MLLSTAYFPPVEYFAILAKYSVVYLEAHENYAKQSYRNRCRILTANGVEDLRFPIVHDGTKLITEVKVDYKTPWVRQTEYAIDSAYYSSPFFEYYRDGVFAILDSHPETLWDLNLRLIRFFCAKIGLATDLRLTMSYAAAAGSCLGVASAVLHPSQAGAWVPPVYETTGGHGPAVDTPSRGEWGPLAGSNLPPERGTEGVEKSSREIVADDFRDIIHPKKEAIMATVPYWQVFREKFGFVPNLSVMDLLFNEGPESICYLK